MKRGLFQAVFLLCALLTAIPSPAQATAANAKAFVDKTAQTIEEIFSRTGNRDAELTSLFTYAVDWRAALCFTMTTHCRQTSDEQLDEMSSNFARQSVRMLVSYVTSVEFRSVSVGKPTPLPNSGNLWKVETVVTVAPQSGGSEGNSLSRKDIYTWTIRCENQECKVFNLAFQGHDFLITKREQHKRILQRAGIEGLASQLREDTAATQ